MTVPRAIVDLQIALEKEADIPKHAQLQSWVDAVLVKRTINIEEPELTIRFVDTQEIHDLNLTYRGKDKATNVLSFPYEAMPGIVLPLLGDIVICPSVMEREAAQQNKKNIDHYAHLVIHGVLHLLGYDHIEEDEANAMECLEVEILAKLGIDDPYQDLQ